MGTSKHRVFRPSKPSHLAFALPKPGFLAFGWAYRQAATALSKHFDSGENSAIVAPLVFLYRHALESYLKGMLIEYGDDIGITKADVLKRGHRLVVHLQDLQTEI